MIKVNFCDFWPGFESNNLFLKFLKQYFQVVVDEKPDYLFYSVYGSKHLEYDDCIKILYTGENLVPDFNLCDYAIGFHYLEFGDRYLRFPLYVYYQWHYDFLLRDSLLQHEITNRPDSLVNRKFCNFVYSNNVNSDPVRDLFFTELSKYRKVDSGGRHLNNIGGPVKDKLQFIKDYKFTIAFENSSVPGYTTEKLLEPIIAGSLPVYYGNPLLFLDFEPESFVFVKNRADIDRAIDEIISLDKNDEKYMEMLERNKFRIDNNLVVWENKLRYFLKNIFEQSQFAACRKPVYGFNNYYTGEARLKSRLLSKRESRIFFKRKIKSLLSKLRIPYCNGPIIHRTRL